jgi:adenine-specific DNA-methyltransferase
MSVQDKRVQNRQQLQSLLRQLFQFDSADLDFGIYRIMNEKRAEIERFIERDLLDAVEQGLAHFQAAEREELEAQIAAKRDDLGPDAFDESGAVREEYKKIKIAQDYMALRQQLQRLELAAETEARIFNDLWRFFSRYYDNGDFLTERRYSSREPKFCIPYNGQEVLLHWANRDQYYVKTGERFTDYRFTAGEYSVWFRLQHAEESQDNVKGNTRHFVLRQEKPLVYDAEARTLTICFEYRPITEEEEAHFLAVYNAQQTRSERRKTLDRSSLCAALEVQILDGLDDAGLKAHLAAVPAGQNASPLGRHLNRYTARNTMDYFVHKDLGGFLRRELDFFLKNEVLRIEDVIADQTGEVMGHVLTRMRVVRQIAEKIIAFLAQIEDLQRRLFEKKKFVVQTGYCITLDRVPGEFYAEILANEAQLEEWRRLYNVDAWSQDLFWQGKFDEAFLRNYPYVMLDTAFFDDDFKARLLATFDDLDGATDGVLIHGENFQAVNLLQPKYAEQVRCVYLDPPYNTGSDDFLYKDNYRHSSWLAMMADRLSLVRQMLTDDGAIFVQIGDEEQANLRLLLDSIFGEQNFRNTIVVRRGIKSVQVQFEDITSLAVGHDKIFMFSKTDRARLPKLLEMLPESEPGKWDTFWRGTDRKTMRYEIFGIKPDTGQWRWKEERALKAKAAYEEYQAKHSQVMSLDEHYLRHLAETGERLSFVRQNEEGVVQYYVPPRDYKLMSDVWLSVRTRGDVTDFTTEKHIELVGKISDWVAGDVGLTLDFFAGSGTTAHAIMNLNRSDGGKRKYILIEVGDYFDTVLKPRLQRVAFSANWSNGIPQDRDGQSHMFKYQRIESYEDALNNIRVCQPEGAQRRLLYEEFGDYQLHYMLDFETRDSPTLLAPEAFEKPFAYTLKIQRGRESPQETAMDLVETFHYLIGMHVHRLERHEHQGRAYAISRGEVRSERGIEKVAVVWRDTENLNLNQEADWLNPELPATSFDRVYMNGPSHVERTQPLEITFRERMEPGEGGPCGV